MTKRENQYPGGHIPFTPIVSGGNAIFVCYNCKKIGSFTEKTARGTYPVCDSCIYEYKEKQRLKDNLL